VKRNADAKAGDVLVLGKPLGVGVLSAALKKGVLGDDGYQAMIENTTKLNKPGKALSELPGVHALTDVTGFGLLGHLLELARGAKLTAKLNMSQIPLLPGVEKLAHDGFFTGASGRNWDAYGKDVLLSPNITQPQHTLLTDPQTSGGLLVSCDPASVDEVLALFRSHGFDHAAVIGEMAAGEPRVQVAA
jgi:selenide,water dikinase